MDTCARVLFLSTDDLSGFCCYDEMAAVALERRGVAVQTVSWRQHHALPHADAVIVRSCWDWQSDPEAFVAALEGIAARSALWNPLPLLRWNLDKRYLAELLAAGVPTVPTRWCSDWDPEALEQARAQFGVDELVVKPVFGANADDTWRLRGSPPASLAEVFRGRAHMIQPFVDAVTDFGEVSLIAFDGRFSHALRKQPADGDFRVQEEHGGRFAAWRPEPALLELLERLIACLPTPALYLRADFVPGTDGWWLMELEAVEPSLYFPVDPDSADRFADAVVRWLSEPCAGRDGGAVEATSP